MFYLLLQIKHSPYIHKELNDIEILCLMGSNAMYSIVLLTSNDIKLILSSLLIIFPFFIVIYKLIKYCKRLGNFESNDEKTNMEIILTGCTPQNITKRFEFYIPTTDNNNNINVKELEITDISDNNNNKQNIVNFTQNEAEIVYN